MYWRARAWATVAIAASVVGMAAAPGSDPGALKAPNGSLSLTAKGKVELERRGHVSANDAVEIVDGTTRVNADHLEGNGTDAGDSQWVLTGHVQIQTPEGALQADRATAQLAHSHITLMTAEGMPVQFQRAASDGEAAAHGHARSITYDLEHGHLQLDGDSWLTYGCDEVESQHIQYDIAAGRVEAMSGDGAQVRGLIRASSSAQCSTGHIPAGGVKP